MAVTLCENVLDGTPMCRDEWIEAMRTHGLQFRFDSGGSDMSTINSARADGTDIVDADIAWQSVSPMMHHPTVQNAEYLYLQIVKGGALSIVQHGQTMTFRPGDMVVLDPLAKYEASVREATHMSIVRMPKSALRERGLRERFRVVHRPDLESPDVRAVREFMVYLTSQAGKVSEALLARLVGQGLDLMEVLANDRNGSAWSSPSAAIALRAKQLIARRIGDPDLNVASIAAVLNVSTRTVSRALRANGISAMRYVWSMRLEHAAGRLASAPQVTIQEIAYRCGFTSPSHFSREFRKRYDMTPREYVASREGACGHAPGK
ncbi:helix-turn-helix transcriptional regulator [Paraburkholderia humisilvae]|uniref:HTH-type transcriptional activator RhaS n=1 Tax=Paraburkholderia humisilvae TaxID=627669 RepID=A0A6J5CXF2_9BURK|nr:AraC family transcriptional regulator [Paraburkholderia humisilvae]CAB3745821.1 HTH-type transcriptional activator RhaS [Paraburkholderia humisilvae]